ncbi:MAG: hypothetical protein GF307_05615 [candidate division Zixibacteria bacterium]|nr:hypothetical protein [candidate division Zixibacteria bacterium]
MDKSMQLEERILPVIQTWLSEHGSGFVVRIKDFCLGNRASLADVRTGLKELGIVVFAGESGKLDEDLLEGLEYGIFDLIGKFSSFPGEPALKKAIKEKLAVYLTDIFADVKRKWNFATYKETESYEAIDPENCLIPASEPEDGEEFRPDSEEIRKEAVQVLSELTDFARKKFRGDKIRRIAVSWLENPEKEKDFGWLAALVDTTPNSVKVNLTRIRQALNKNYRLRKNGDRLVLMRTGSTGL